MPRYGGPMRHRATGRRDLPAVYGMDSNTALEVGTRRVVFVSSGGVVYGEPEEIPTPETAPKLPLSPSGVTKLAGE